LLHRIAHYKDSEYNNTVLWEYIREDFVRWTKKTWAPAKKDIVWDFHDFLWENGVFVPKDGGAIGDNIQEQVIDTKEEHEWTPQEIEYQLHTMKKFNSQWNPSNTPLEMLLPSSSTHLYQPIQPTTLTSDTTPEQEQPIMQLPPPPFQSQTKSVSKLLTELAKLYSDQENKFGGELYDVLNSKLHIFYNCCQKVGIEFD